MQATIPSPSDSDKYADISIQVLQRMFVLLDILAERDEPLSLCILS